jgi:ABC-type multidrug transport system fused ATPase/permease subunit
VLWDQAAVTDIDPEQLRDQIAVIAQDHANWPLTVRHNITMGRAADPAMLAEAATAAGADTAAPASKVHLAEGSSRLRCHRRR